MKKALWVVSDRITTPEAIDDLLEASAVRGIFDLVAQVRGRGDAYYTSSLEPRAAALTLDLDPLDRLIRYGAAIGVRIHAWANVHHADAANAGARAHTIRVFEDIVTRYRVEGLHYDFVRDPRVTDPRSPEAHTVVTALVRESAARIRRARPNAVISAAVLPDPVVARERVPQRWPEWAAEGLVDILCPMAFRRDSTEVARLLSAARAAAPKTELWGGLMGYAGEPERLRAQVAAARDAGCEGAILFAYDPAQRDLLDVFATT